MSTQGMPPPPGLQRCRGCQTAMPAMTPFCPACTMPTAAPVAFGGPAVPAVPAAAVPVPPAFAVAPAAPASGRQVTLTLPAQLPSLRILAPALVALVLLAAWFVHSSGGHGAPALAAPAAGVAGAAVPSAGSSPAAAASVGAGLIAHGKLVSTGPSDGSSICPLEGSTLTATGDDGTIVGAAELKGTLSAGACDYAFSFPVKSTVTVNFRAGAYRAIGPDGHDGQVLSSALDKDLLLYVM